MLFSRLTGLSMKAFFLLGSAVLILAAGSMPAAAQTSSAALETLLDKSQIENLLVDYYAELGSGGHSYSDFYVEDGVLDVNGIVAQGKKGIEDLYKKVAAGSPVRKGTFRMLLTNLKITVNGNAGTADVLWTGINSETVHAAPQLVEQGREHDELVKRNGRWYFKHRIITADGGMPALYDKTYKKR